VTSAERTAFAERVSVQIASRYAGAPVEVDALGFAIRIGGPGSAGTTLALAPLHQACLRSPAETPRLIASFVASVEKQLQGGSPLELSTARLLWCVRARRDIDELKRAADLLSVDIGAGLVAFVAESLPGSIMRGVPRQEWMAQGLADPDVHSITSRNTEQHFARLLARMRGAGGERVPADGWRMAGDPLFQGSVLMVPTMLQALHDLAGGDVLIAVPDRGVVLAIAARLPGADRFGRRVLREWREAMHPCSRDLLISDGVSLRAVPRRGGRAGSVVMPWLQE
jgi:hypothetical protein